MSLNYQESVQPGPKDLRKLYTRRYCNGAVVNLLQSPGFYGKTFTLTIPCGADISEYEVEGQRIKVPEGSAHFLEHLCFERSEVVDQTKRLSRGGTKVNAQTGGETTVFSASGDERLLDILPDFCKLIYAPDLSEAALESERPVIFEELSEYEDDPDSNCLNLIYAQLYHSHPLRSDIVGSRESLAAINSQDLQSLHRAFYHPARSIFTLCGDFAEPQAAMDILGRIIEAAATAPVLKAVSASEADEVRVARSKHKAELQMPRFMLGLKLPEAGLIKDESAFPFASPELFRERLSVELASAALLSQSSPIFATLYQEGLVNESFSAGFSLSRTAGAWIMGGAGPKPARALSRLRDLLEKQDLDSAEYALAFERQRRNYLGLLYSQYDSLAAAAELQEESSFFGLSLFDQWTICDSIKVEHATRLLKLCLKAGLYSVVTLQARGGLS